MSKSCLHFDVLLYTWLTISIDEVYHWASEVCWKPCHRSSARLVAHSRFLRVCFPLGSPGAFLPSFVSLLCWTMPAWKGNYRISEEFPGCDVTANQVKLHFFSPWSSCSSFSFSFHFIIVINFLCSAWDLSQVFSFKTPTLSQSYIPTLFFHFNSILGLGSNPVVLRA